MGKPAAECYLDHLGQIFKIEPEYIKYSPEGELPPFHALVYRDIPEPGMLSAITMGASWVEPVDGIEPRQELLISVDSNDIVWAFVLADIADQRRGKYHFTPGTTINVRGNLSEGSSMNSLLVWHQGLIQEDRELICLPDWHVEFMQLFPIHADEAALISQHGTDWFFGLVSDPSDVKRPSVAALLQAKGDFPQS